MSKKLQNISCRADFPDDDIWDDDVLVRTNGLNTATAVAEILKSEGMKIEGPSEHHEHGWELEINRNDQEFWMQVTVLDPSDVYINTRDESAGWLASLLGKKSNYPDFLQIVHDRLSNDGRFHDIRWHPYVKRDQLPGALSPTSPPGPEKEFTDN